MNKNPQTHRRPALTGSGFDPTASILENLECGVILVDSRLTVLSINQWLIDHSGIRLDPVVGRNFMELFPGMKKSQLAKSIEAALRYEIKSILTPDINLTPLPLFEKNKEKAPLNHVIHISPVKGPDGAIFCLMQIGDVASASLRDRLYYEKSLRMHDEAEALRESSRHAMNANKAKSEFLALMSHELRTPLNAIIGFADILKDEILGPHTVHQYQEYSTDISEAGNHLLTLINDILDLSKIDAGKYALHEEVVDVPEIIRSAENLLRHQVTQNAQKLEIIYPDDLPDLRVDSRSLKQMILNLLSNAVKFTPDKGHIRLTVDRNEEQDMRISVSDDGIGIAAHEIPLIMQPFTQSESNMTRQQPGTGLGLSLVKKMVEMHEGRINLESRIGKGTTVTLTFPRERVIEI